MSLRFTNSLTSRTEAFEPLTEGKVSMYCCGVTVYDLCHLGHARSYINWDVLRRYLIWRGYDVTYVQNYTDIDDKILKRAKEEAITMQEVSERNIEAFEVDMGRLNILPADRMPRATCCIEGIQTLISEVLAQDPRPSYLARRQERRHGVHLWDLNVVWRSEEGHFLVTHLEPIDASSE